MRGIIPGDPEWTASVIEKLLRDGHHIYFEDNVGPLGRAEFKDGLFKFIRDPLNTGGLEDIVAKETDSFLEFAAWAAFYGRDFL